MSLKKNIFPFLNKEFGISFVLHVFFYGTVFLFLFLLASLRLDPDFGWHLRVGQEFLQNGTLDTETHLFPTLGDRWVNHDWLANIFLFTVFSSSENGYRLLAAFFSFVIMGIFYSLTHFVHSLFLSRIPRLFFLFCAFFLQMLSIAVIATYFGIRPQLFSWVFFVTEILLFVTAFHKRTNTPLFFLPPLFLFWANMHGTFVVGLFIFFLFFAVHFFEKENLKKKFFTGTLFVASAFITLCTPHPLELWHLVIIEYSQNPYYLSHITEWIPLYSISPFLLKEFFFIVFIVACFLFFGIAHKKVIVRIPKNLGLFLFLLGSLLFCMAIGARRNFPLFVLYAYPILLIILTKTLSMIHILQRKSFILLSTVFLCIVIHTAIFPKYIEFPSKNPFSQPLPNYPYGAVRFLQENPRHQQQKLFNVYDWGGYLSWTVPDMHVFIDGRMPQRPLRNNNSYLEEYNLFFKKNEMKQQIHRYAIETLLLRKNSSKPNFSSPKIWIARTLFHVNIKDGKSIEKDLEDYAREHGVVLFEDDLSVLITLKKDP